MVFNAQRAAAGAAAAGLCVAALAACTSGSNSSKTSNGSSTPAPSSSHASATKPATPPPSFVGTQHPLPTDISNSPELYKVVKLTGCAATSDGWSATGTVTTAGDSAVDYKILVLFTDAQARDVDSAEATVTGQPGKATSWTATKQFKAPAGTKCVVRAVSKG